MAKFILGKKIAMSQVFKDNRVIPVTKIKAGPCLVIQVKEEKKDGYQAVQIGFGSKKKINKPLQGHLKKAQALKDNNRYLREFLISADSELKKGDKIKADVFKPGDKVKVSSISKGKGFQGVVKRHGFHGSPASHGHKDQLRMPGSAGATGPARVFKNKKMPGRMGGKRITISNLEIVEVDPQNNIILVKGAVPGAINSFLEIKEN